MSESIACIQQLCREADSAQASSLHEQYGTDNRAGVRKALASMDRRLEKDALERVRVNGLYTFEDELRSKNGTILSVGLDEVGRGPIAGPVSIGAVVFDLDAEPVWGINDSKKLSEAKRMELSGIIKERALAYDVISISAQEIDKIGISAALRKAFSEGISSVEKQLVEMGREGQLGLVALDGNPMKLDEREVNIIKGDAKVASISAASIIAKVERDEYMSSLDAVYPEYGFASNKGYGSAAHIEAIREYGLTPEHRASFCKNFVR